MKFGYITQWLLFGVLVLLIGATQAWAGCPLHIPQPMLREEIARADLVLFGEWAAPCGDGETSEVVVHTIFKDHPILGKKKVMHLGRSYLIGQSDPPPVLLFLKVHKGKVQIVRCV